MTSIVSSALSSEVASAEGPCGRRARARPGHDPAEATRGARRKKRGIRAQRLAVALHMGRPRRQARQLESIPLIMSFLRVSSNSVRVPILFFLNFLMLAKFSVQTFELSIYYDCSTTNTMHFSLSRSNVHKDKHHAFFFVEIRCCCKLFALFSCSSCIIQWDIVAHNVCTTFSH